MAVCVAYPVASPPDSVWPRQRIPQSTTGEDSERNSFVALRDVDFMIACLHAQNDVRRRHAASYATATANKIQTIQPIPERSPLQPRILHQPLRSPLGEVVQVGDEHSTEVLTDYTTSENLASYTSPLSEEHLPYHHNVVYTPHAPILVPATPTRPKVDFSSTENVRSHAKKKKGGAKKSDAWDGDGDGDEKKEAPAGDAGGSGEGAGNTGGGATGGSGGNDGNDEDKEAGDNWGGWDTGKKKKKGKKAQQDEEEDQEEDQKPDSFDVWPNTTTTAEKDDDWGYSAATKKKGKKTKAQQETPAEENFHEISLGDDKSNFDFIAPKINLSFDEPASKTDTTSPLWGNSWNFGGFGSKKEPEKSAKADEPSHFANFNFGFSGSSAAAGTSSFDIGDSKKDDEEDIFPQYDTAWGSSALKTKKKKAAIQEVDDTLPNAKAKDEEDSWAWGAKEVDKKSPVAAIPGLGKTSTGWGSSFVGSGLKKDQGKISKSFWADDHEDDDGNQKGDDPVSTGSKGWGSTWGTSTFATFKPKKSSWDTSPNDDPWSSVEKDKTDLPATTKDEELPEEKPTVTELPPLSILKGLTINKDGNILDLDNVIVGEVIEGDAAKFARLSYLCDEEGNIRNSKNKVMGKAQTVPQTKPIVSDADAPDLSALEGLTVDRDDAKVYNDAGIAIGELVDGDAKTIARRQFKCNAQGQFLDKKDVVVGQAKLLEPETPALEEAAIDKEPETSESKAEDLSILEGLVLDREDHKIYDADGFAVGELVDTENAKIIAKRGYKCIGGKFFDKKGTVMGEAKLCPFDDSEAIEDVDPKPEDDKVDDVKPSEPEPLDTSCLDGLTCETDGQILNLDGVAVGKLIEGDAKTLAKKMFTCNAEGVFRDKKFKSVGRAEVLQPEKLDDSVEKSESKTEDSAKPTRTLADLEGMTCDEDGLFLIDGIAVAELVDGDATVIFKRKYLCNSDGEVLNKKKNVIGTVQLLPDTQSDEKPAVESPPTSSEPPPLSILEGMTIEKDGKILDFDKKQIGEVTEGDPMKFHTSMFMCDAEGNVLNYTDRPVGKCRTIAPEGTASADLKEESKSKEEPPVEQAPADGSPPLSILEGRLLEMDGKVLDADFEVIGKMTEGDASKLYKKGAKCDAEGNLVVKNKIVGKVRTIAPDPPVAPAAPEVDDEPALPEPVDEPTASDLPPISILAGRTIEKDGKILNDDYEVIGEVVEGNTKKLASSMATCDAEGNIISKKKVVGKAKVVATEIPVEPEVEETSGPSETESPFSIVAGRTIGKNGDVLDAEGNVVAKVVQSDISNIKLFRSKATCDGEGNIISNDKKVGTVELVVPDEPVEEEQVEEETKEEPAPEPKSAPLAVLEGRIIQKSGDVLDDDGIVIGRLASSDSTAPKLFKGGAKCDADGNILFKNKKVGTVELVEVEKPIEEVLAEEAAPAEEESPAKPSLAILDERPIEKSGDILDADGKIIGKIASCEHTPAKLVKASAKCDANGNILAKGKSGTWKEVGKAELVAPSAPEPDVPDVPDVSPPPELPSLAVLENRIIEASGEILDDEKNVIGRVVASTYSSARLFKNKATCDAEGHIICKGKEMGTVELAVPPEAEAPVAEAEAEAEAEAAAESPEEPAPVVESEAAPADPPSFAILDGRPLLESGNVEDDDGNVIAKLSESKHSAKKLFKSKAVCDAEGNLICKGKEVGKVELVEKASEPEPEPEPEPVPEPEAEAPEPEPETAPLTLAILDGRFIQESGDILDDDDKVIGKLIAGGKHPAKRLFKNKAVCDAEGHVLYNGKEVGTVELVLPDPAEAVPEEDTKDDPPAEKEESPEAAPALTLAALDGRKIEKSGDVLDDDFKVIGRLVEGSPAKLFKGTATCDSDGNAILKGKISGKVGLVEPEPEPEPEPAPLPDAEVEPEVVPEPEPEVPTLAILDGRKIETSGEVLDDDFKVIGKLVEGSPARLYKGTATCDAEGNAVFRGKPAGKVELVEQAKVEDAIDEPEPEAESPSLAILEGRKIEKSGEVLDDDGTVIGKLVEGSPTILFKGTSTCDGDGNAILRGNQRGRVELVLPGKTDDPWDALADEWGTSKDIKEDKTDAVQELLASIDNPDTAWGDPWGGNSSKGKKKRDSVAANSTTADKPGDSASKSGGDWDTWSNSTKSKDKKVSVWGSKDKAKGTTPKSETSNPFDESKIMKPAGVDEPKAEVEEESGFAFTNKKGKDKKKRNSKNTPVEVEDNTDIPLQKAETVSETKSGPEADDDWAFASNRVKAKAGKNASPSKTSKTIARAPSPPDQASDPKVIEAAPPAGGKTKKKEAKSSTKEDATELSKTASKGPDDAKDIEKAADLSDGDDLGPDDSASTYKVAMKTASVKSKLKKDETPAGKVSSMWGLFGGGKASSKSKTMAELKKEREEREVKDKEEREKQEQQDREKEELVERERLEEERLEQERIEQEERDRAIKELEEEEKLRKAAKKGGKKGKGASKSSAKISGSKVEVEAETPPPAPAPEPEDESSPPKGAKISATKSLTNQDDPPPTKDAKKLPENELLLPVRTKSSASTSAGASKAGTKESKSASAVKGASVAERIKALQGETKVKEVVAPTPPPPAPVVEVKASSKAAAEPPATAKKSTSASKKAAGKTGSKSSKKVVEPEPEPEPEPAPDLELDLEEEPKSVPGGFPDSDDEPVIDLPPASPPTPSPAPVMGAKPTAKGTKKLDKKAISKSSKSKPVPKAVEKEVIEVEHVEEVEQVEEDLLDSETETEPDKAAVNAEGTQGSGSTTAVDDNSAAINPDGDSPKKSSTLPAKKERAKVVRQSGTSSWGFWGATPAKQSRPKTKESTPAPQKSAAPVVMAIRPRPSRKASAPEPERLEPEKKTPSKPTPKRATTFSLFGPTPTRSKSSRQTPTQKLSSRPQSRRVSPERTDAQPEEETLDEIPRVSAKAEKVMRASTKSGAAASRRASVKSKGVLDPLVVDEDFVALDNGVDKYAESSPAAPAGEQQFKRRSVATSAGLDAPTTSANDDDLSVGIGGASAELGVDSHDLASTARKPSLVRRSTTRATPSDKKGLMGIFGLSRSKSVKEPRRAAPSVNPGKPKLDGYGSDDGYPAASKRDSAYVYNDEADRRARRERRQSRRETDDNGFITDAPGATTDYEESDRRRAERRAARKAENDRLAEEARAAAERESRRRDRDAERDARRAARHAIDEERRRAEDDARRREEKEVRRAARRARDDEVRRREDQARLDEEARLEKEDRRARRREDRERADLASRMERPRTDRRRSSYMPQEDDYQRRSSKRTERTPAEPPIHRESRAEPIGDYFDARNAGQSSAATPYIGSSGDKTSSWVESVNKEPPLPIPPEDVATVLDDAVQDTNGDRDLTTDDEEVRHRMQGRTKDRRRESTRLDQGSPKERDREERRRDRKRRDRDQLPPVRSSDSGTNDRRRRNYYDDSPEYASPAAAPMERPANPKRASWFKKMF